MNREIEAGPFSTLTASSLFVRLILKENQSPISKLAESVSQKAAHQAGLPSKQNQFANANKNQLHQKVIQKANQPAQKIQNWRYQKMARKMNQRVT